MVELVYAPVITAVKGVSVLLDIDLEVRIAPAFCTKKPDVAGIIGSKPVKF